MTVILAVLYQFNCKCTGFRSLPILTIIDTFKKMYHNCTACAHVYYFFSPMIAVYKLQVKVNSGV